MLLVAVVVACSVVFAWWFTAVIGLDSVRLALRWAFGPATVLSSIAGVLLGRVHDLTELKGISPRVIDRLRPKVRVIHVRLWILLISLVLLALVGALIGAVPVNPVAINWIRYASIGTLAGLVAVMLYGVIYLPWLFWDYSSFRMKSASLARAEELRAEVLKAFDTPDNK